MSEQNIKPAAQDHERVRAEKEKRAEDERRAGMTPEELQYLELQRVALDDALMQARPQCRRAESAYGADPTESNWHDVKRARRRVEQLEVRLDFVKSALQGFRTNELRTAAWVAYRPPPMT